jgi:hypothetical protein
MNLNTKPEPEALWRSFRRRRGSNIVSLIVLLAMGLVVVGLISEEVAAVGGLVAFVLLFAEGYSVVQNSRESLIDSPQETVIKGGFLVTRGADRPASRLPLIDRLKGDGLHWTTVPGELTLRKDQIEFRVEDRPPRLVDRHEGDGLSIEAFSSSNWSCLIIKPAEGPAEVAVFQRRSRRTLDRVLAANRFES